jgi:hypothetical protein
LLILEFVKFHDLSLYFYTYEVLAQKIDACGVLVIKSERWRLLVRPNHRWQDNTKMAFKQYDGMAWTDFIWLRKGTSGGLL